MPPRLSIVVLTWNEQDNIAACLLAMARQRAAGFEVIVIDAGSRDGTLASIRAVRSRLGFPLRVHVGRPGMPIGEARNLGVAMANAPRVAFVSADAQLESEWVGQALASLKGADMAFGPQIHAPPRWTLGAAVRGLRYQFPHGPTPNPLAYASNVAAAYNKRLLQRFPFDPWANAAEDLLLARRASAAGYRATYNPGMVVRHGDVMSLRQEMRKNLREGQGCGHYAGELGIRWSLLAWFAMLALGLGLLLANLGLGLVTLGIGLWLPALRRGLRRWGAMPARPLWAGIAASPIFDLVFLIQYLRGLAGSRWNGRHLQPPETPT